jgi:2-methylisocitrate lyase-like PEP mutase family enzyme
MSSLYARIDSFTVMRAKRLTAIIELALVRHHAGAEHRYPPAAANIDSVSAMRSS